MIKLTDEMRVAIGNALTDRTPLIVAYVDADDQPSISYRGSTHAHSDDQLAIWVRNPNGGILKAVATRPKVSLLYRNPETRTMWAFQGRARVDDSPQVRQRVYDSSPEPERNLDKERAGKALIIDLDRVISRGEVLMER